MTTTTQERETQQAHARDVLARLLPRKATTLYTLTTYTRGQTDYVRIFTVHDGAIKELTYYVGVLAGRKQKEKQGLAYGGGQYSKALECADDCWRARFGEPFPQGPAWGEGPHWVEL
jgi:hypothetical protein